MNPAEFKAIVESHGAVRRDGRDWRGRCPAHDDSGRRGDLTFSECEGKILVRCWGGCSTESIVGALGLKMKDLFVNNGNGKLKHRQPKTKSKPVYATVAAAGSAIAKRLSGQHTASWTYTTADGKELFQVLRFDHCRSLNGEKTYRPIYRDGVGYVEGDPPGPLPLYRLPELLANAEDQVTVHEGEKSADAAASIGLLSTCWAHGALSTDKTDFSPLAGRDVWLFPDRDNPGEKAMLKVVNKLLSLDPPAKVKIVKLPDLPAHGDIFDWLEEHDAVEPEALAERIIKLAEAAPFETKPESSAEENETVRPVFVWMKDVEAKPVQWLWRDRVPSAMLSMFIGLEGSGKTFCALDLAARITTGRLLPGGTGPYDVAPIGNVVFLTSEDHLSFTVRPRLDAMGADSARIVALKGVKYPEGDTDFFDVMRHLPALELLIQEADPVRLVLVDPLTAFLGKTDQHKNGEVRMALAGFNALAERHNCAVIGISHLSKDISRAALHRTIGSVAFSAAARAVWLVSADKDIEGRVLFVPVKLNLAPMAKSLAFRIEGMALQWETQEFEYKADEVLAVNREEPGALADACQWLEGVLADGKVRSSEIWKMAKEEKISDITLRRAKTKLSIIAQKHGIGSTSFWYWELSKALK